MQYRQWQIEQAAQVNRCHCHCVSVLDVRHCGQSSIFNYQALEVELTCMLSPLLGYQCFLFFLIVWRPLTREYSTVVYPRHWNASDIYYLHQSCEQTNIHRNEVPVR